MAKAPLRRGLFSFMGSAYAADMKERVLFYFVFTLWGLCQLALAYDGYLRIRCR